MCFFLSGIHHCLINQRISIQMQEILKVRRKRGDKTKMMLYDIVLHASPQAKENSGPLSLALVIAPPPPPLVRNSKAEDYPDTNVILPSHCICHGYTPF